MIMQKEMSGIAAEIIAAISASIEMFLIEERLGRQKYRESRQSRKQSTAWGRKQWKKTLPRA